MKLSNQLIISFLLVSFACLIIGASAFFSISNIEHKLNNQVKFANISNKLVEARDNIFDYLNYNNRDHLIRASQDLEEAENELNNWDVVDLNPTANTNKIAFENTIEIFRANYNILRNNTLNDTENWAHVVRLNHRIDNQIDYFQFYAQKASAKLNTEHRLIEARAKEIDQAKKSLEVILNEYLSISKDHMIYNHIVKNANSTEKNQTSYIFLAKHFSDSLNYSKNLLNDPAYSKYINQLQSEIQTSLFSDKGKSLFLLASKRAQILQQATNVRYTHASLKFFLLKKFNRNWLETRNFFEDLNEEINQSDKINSNIIFAAKQFIIKFNYMQNTALQLKKHDDSFEKLIAIVNSNSLFYKLSHEMSRNIHAHDQKQFIRKKAFSEIASAMNKTFAETRVNNAQMLSEAEDLRENAVSSIMLNVALAIILGIYATIFIARRITRDFKKITHTMLELSKGNLDNEVPFTSRRDEIGDMAGALEIFKNNALELKKVEVSLKRIVGAIESSSDAIIIFDADGNVIHFNQSFLKCFDIRHNKNINKSAFDKLHKNQASVKVYQECFDSGVSWDGEIIMINGQNQELTMTLRLDPIKDDDANIMGYVALYTDITERKKAENHIKKLAHFDPLTGLANRTQFLEKISSQLKTSKIQNSEFAVLMLDLDRFKQVNDTMGHDAGDILLSQVADRIMETVGEENFAARLGGDEFALILDYADISEAQQVALMIADSLKIKFEIMGQEVLIGGSVGISHYPRDGMRATGLMKKADMALYEAKSNGRGTIALYDDSLLEETERRRRVEQSLRKGIEDKEFHLMYQPKVCLESGKISSAEALLRWKHKGEMMNPEDFIPIAEDTGLMNEIGRFALRKACSQAKKWENIDIAINVSPSQFHNGNLIEHVKEAIEYSSISPKRMIIEITEGLLLKDDQLILEQLEVLRSMGIRISLDDFGTGYSSLGYLATFPLDELKIDRSFTNNIGTEEGCGIVQSVIDLSKTLGLRTVAEGVETIEQYAFLKGSGCSLVQGYLFSKPITHEEIMDAGSRKYTFSLEDIMNIKPKKEEFQEKIA